MRFLKNFKKATFYFNHSIFAHHHLIEKGITHLTSAFDIKVVIP